MTSRSKFPIPFMMISAIILTIVAMSIAAISTNKNTDKNIESTTYILTTNEDKTVPWKETTRFETTTKKTEPKQTTTKSVTQSQNTTSRPTTTTSAITSKNNLFSENDIISIAKILYSECRGVGSETQKACVVWVICNRVDAYGTSIQSVINSKNQFCYNRNAPIREELYSIAKDVLERWSREKQGESNVGRVLPKNYLYFHGDGKVNYFKTGLKEPYTIWDYSLPSPYNT